MFTFWLISFIICIVQLYYVRVAKLKMKTRDDVYQRWDSINWVYLNEPVKISRLYIGIWVISSLIPFINIITIIFGSAFIVRYSYAPKDSGDYSRVIYNFHLTGRLIDWLLEEV